LLVDYVHEATEIVVPPAIESLAIEIVAITAGRGNEAARLCRWVRRHIIDCAGDGLWTIEQHVSALDDLDALIAIHQRVEIARVVAIGRVGEE
jgi:transglutaminase-like putative cysteine protease